MADRFERWLEQNERAIVISLLVLFAAVSVLRAATLRFWFDELITVYLSRASLGELWSAMLDGTEQQAFLASLIFRPFASSTLWPEVVARIPSIAGYVAMLGGIYAFARYRWSATVSLIAMLAPCLTRSVDYAQQARSYALAMGLCAWALVCWQRSASEPRRGHWLLGLWFTLSAAILCHYFAVLMLVPLAIAELFRRRVDLPLWSALACSVLPLASMWNVIAAVRQATVHHWSHPAWAQWHQFYSELPHVYTYVLLALIAWRIPYALRARAMTPVWEVAAIVMLAAVPLVGLAVGVLVTHVYTWRFVEFAVVGLALLIAAVVERGTRSAWDRVLIAVIVIGGGVVAPLGVVSWRAALGNRPARFAPILPELAPRPIVVADALAFLELQHYAPAELRPRIVYLADLPTALAVTGTDSADLSLLGLSKRVTPLQVALPAEIKFNQAWLLGSSNSVAAQSLRSLGFQLRSTADVGVLDATRTFSQIH